MRIVLVCNAGMSTSVLVQKMQKSAEKKGIDAKIDAYSVDVLDEVLEQEKVDCILVGPQIRHMLPNIKTMVDGKIPVATIEMRDYGMMNGEAVLAQAIGLVEV